MGKRKRRIVLVVINIVLFTFSAVLFIANRLSGYRFVRVAPLESMAGVRLLDPNWPGFEIKKADSNPNHPAVNWKHSAIHLSGKSRVKQCDRNNLQVMGQLLDGKQYRVVIDSGFPHYLDVTDTIVLESRLEIYPMKPLCYKHTGGVCHLCQLKIGDLTIVHAPCQYRLAHYERRLFGRTIWKQKQINLGLGLMREFAYILIDNVAREVEFSAAEGFNVGPHEQWTSYPMTIEPDDEGQDWLAVDIPLAGRTRHVRFDTGVASSLLLAQSRWARISPDLKVVKKTKDKLLMLHGLQPCKKITVAELAVGNLRISDALINVIDDSNPWGPDFFLLGMGSFKNAVVVLDFEHKLMWVKNLHDG